MPCSDLTDEETRRLLADLQPDDRTTLFEELPGQVTQRLLNLLSPEDCVRHAFSRLSGIQCRPSYDSQLRGGTAGMDRGPGSGTLSGKGTNSETLHVIYVVDANWKLLDALELSRFIMAEPSQKVEEIMNHSFVSLSAFDHQEEAVKTMQKYDLYSLPVVDSGGSWWDWSPLTMCWM